MSTNSTNSTNSTKFKRPSWDEYFLTIAKLTSERSNCIKRKVGCIIVKNNRILSLGYNGTPRGTKNCYEGGCKRCMDQYTNAISQAGTHLDLCMCLHAEENAMLYVSQNDLDGATMYVTLIPCIGCVKKIIQCNIKKIIYIENYSLELDKMSIEMLSKVGIEIENINL